MEIIRYVKEDGSVPFAQWLSSLRDLQAEVAVRRRIDRFIAGNPGTTSSLRAGVNELKVDVGPGYRVYFARHGTTVVLLLCGGNKGTQEADIAKAIGYWEDWKTRNRRAS